MSDDFEHNMNQRMQDFRIDPGPQIWERVAAALPLGKKRRRFAIWWWLLPLAACLGGGIWLGLRKSNQPVAVVIQEKAKQIPVTKTDDQLIDEKQSDTSGKDYTKQKSVDKNKTTPGKQEVTTRQSSDIKKKDIVIKSVIKTKENKDQSNSDFVVTRTTTKAEVHNLLERHTKKANDAEKEVGYVLNKAEGSTQLQKSVITDSASINKQPLLTITKDSVAAIPETLAKKDTAIKQEADSILPAIAAKQHPSTRLTIKKTAWDLVFGAGTSNLKGGFNEANKSLSNNFSNGGLGSTPVNRGIFTDPGSGLYFSAGVLRRQIISKHWSWQAALYYQYLSSRQITGSSNDSLRLSDALTQVAYNAVRFYTGTTSPANPANPINTVGVQRTNGVHRLQILPGIQFTLNPSATSPVSFTAGVGIAYNLVNHLLLHDYRSYSYIRSSALSNKLMISAEGGLDVFMKHKIHAGIFFAHDFTNVAKSPLLSSFHWNQLQVRIGIPLNKQ